MIKAAEVFRILEHTHQLTMLEQFSSYTPFQLLVMTLLSSRTRDATTIPMMPGLFRKYPTPGEFLEVPLATLKKDLYGIGFYRVKAENIKKLSQMVLEKYHGKIPDSFEELTSLPGVGRKTANCILNYAFKKPAIAVDVHVHRIANRLGWVKTKTPEETEFALQKLLLPEQWGKVNMLFVDHGQRICLPWNPKCGVCPMVKWCEFGRGRSM